MIYLVPGRQNLSIISLFPTASQETACLFNAVFVKVQCCMRRSKGRGKGIRNPPPWKIQTYQIYMLKLPSPPPPPQTRLQSPPLGKWFLIRAWCSQTNFDNLRTSTDFFFRTIVWLLSSLVYTTQKNRYFTPTRTKLIDPDSENQGCNQGRWHFKRKMNESIRGL